jgi:hypothetical protein
MSGPGVAWMKRCVLKAMFSVVAVLGSLVAVSLPAQALPNCERFAKTPDFSGTFIYGTYWVTCTATVSQASLYGRIKEDRVNQPDVVHMQGRVLFTNTNSFSMIKYTCQNGDDIYNEAQINSEKPYQSSRAEMHC